MNDIRHVIAEWEASPQAQALPEHERRRLATEALVLGTKMTSDEVWKVAKNGFDALEPTEREPGKTYVVDILKEARKAVESAVNEAFDRTSVQASDLGWDQIFAVKKAREPHPRGYRFKVNGVEQ